MASDRSAPRGDDSRRNETERASSTHRRWSTRRRVLQSIGIVGTVAVAGCLDLLSGGSPTPDWRRELSNASGASPPAVGGDRLLVGAQDKQLHAFDVESGDRAFAYETGGPIESRPVVAAGDGLSHVRSTDGDVYTVDESGDRLWHREGTYRRGDLARAGSLLVENVPQYDDPAIRGFDATTGDVRFTVPTSHYQLPGLTAAGFALRIPADGDRSRVAVLSLADGSVRWETDRQPPYGVVVADEELVVTYRDDTVTAYAIDDGTRQWHQRLDDVRWEDGPDLGAQVYLTYETGEREGVLALDRSTGDVQWQNTVGYQVRHVEPSADAVFVGSRGNGPDGDVSGRLDCFERDGTRRWKTIPSVPDVENVAVLEETVLLVSERSLVALDRSTGATQWTHDPESHSRLALATEANSVYVSYLDDGAVAKFALP